MNKQEYRANEQILRSRPGEPRVRDVRVIDDENEQLGIMNVRDALQLARERGLDLVEFAPQATPPVCRIIDYGKFKYEQGKRENEQRKKQKQQELKGIKMRPVTAEHDFQVRVRQTQKFLEEGDKVKITIQFKAREITHPELGRKLLDKMIETIGDKAIVEKPPSIEGKLLTAILSPKAS